MIMRTRILLLVVAGAVRLGAQGNLSTQGYGYPQGQLTARAQSMGGSTGEIDPSSALNPAALGRLITRTVTFQIEPEFRTVTSAAGTDRTTTARFPLVNIGVPFGERWVIGLGSSSLLDRSWSTTQQLSQVIGGNTVNVTSDESSNGSINDLRLATAWTNHSSVFIGVGAHAMTGRNVVTTLEQFNDSSFNSFTSVRVLDYTGSAISIGGQLTSSAMSTVIGFDYRLGNRLRVASNDTVLSRGDVPSHFGASVGFTGIAGTILAARVAHDGWSSMTPMLTGVGEKAHDAWDFGGGAEFTGPRVIGQTIMLRAGARSRGLPFEAASKTVTERSVSLGSGASFGGGRMVADVTAIRQFRSADLPGLKERAWTLSFSITARP